ncbi:MAG: hypothetical protein Q9201_005981 [Fulgogasparrea decipioides]
MKTFDEWMEAFMADNESDINPLDMPTARQRQVMSDYVKGSTAAEETAVAYTRDLLTDNTSGDPWWFIEMAAQDRPDTHERLVDLVKAIVRLPNERRANGKLQYWQWHLRQLALDLRESWDGKNQYLNNHSDPIEHEIFINLSAFQARLLAQGVCGSTWWPIVALHAALENEYENQPQLLETHVSAAANLIQLAGPLVYSNYKGDVTAPGELFQNASAVSTTDRWQFWKERLADIEKQGDLKRETQRAARSAIDRMLEIENGSK